MPGRAPIQPLHGGRVEFAELLLDAGAGIDARAIEMDDRAPIE